MKAVNGLAEMGARINLRPLTEDCGGSTARAHDLAGGTMMENREVADNNPNVYFPW